MIDVLASLPQGVFWYPVVAALFIVALRRLLPLLSRGSRGSAASQQERGRVVAIAHLIRRVQTDRFAESELERLCIGMLLQTAGYRGYSVDACRHFLEHGAPDRLVPILREHLGDTPPQRRPATGALPARCELIVRELESITEVS